MLPSSRSTGNVISSTCAHGSMMRRMPCTFLRLSSSVALRILLRSANMPSSARMHALWKKYSTMLKKAGCSASGTSLRRSGISHFCGADEDMLAAAPRTAGLGVAMAASRRPTSLAREDITANERTCGAKIVLFAEMRLRFAVSRLRAGSGEWRRRRLLMYVAAGGENRLLLEEEASRSLALSAPAAKRGEEEDWRPISCRD